MESYQSEELFQELKSDNTVLTPLVYRKPHNSTTIFVDQHPYKKQYEFRTYLSITPNRIVKYSKNILPDLRDYSQEWLNKGATINADGSIDKSTVKSTLTEDNRTHGIISKKSSSRINLILDWQILLSKEKEDLNQSTKTFFKWQLNFITLTLASKQIHSDKVIKELLLNDFLIQAKRKFGFSNYFWRAETQRNGNIHFHITTDKFIPWQDVRNLWNHIQQKLNYIDAFEKSFKHRNPNGTDIHSLRKVKNIGAYLSKYCGKNAKGITIQCSKSFTKYENMPLFTTFVWKFPPKKALFFRVVFGKLWGCSQQLSKLKSCKVLMTDAQELELFKFKCKFPNKVKIADYCESFKIDCKQYISLGLNSIRNSLATFVSAILYPVIQLELEI